MNKRPKIYIAGPYSKGDTMGHIRRACKIGMALWKKGYIVYIPHTTGFIDLICPTPYEQWLEFDKEWLLTCDAVLRIPGISAGADAEIVLAAEYNIPVYTDVSILEKGMPCPTREGTAKPVDGLY